MHVLITNSNEKIFSLCEGSYCLLNCYIVSIDRWAMKFRRKLKFHKAKFMERQPTYKPQTYGGSIFPRNVVQSLSRLRT